jgi:hypothetical protein
MSPKVNPLLLELIAAHRKTRTGDLTQALDACGLHQTGGPIFGVERVAIDEHNFAPDPQSSRLAVIIPYFADCELLDLVAVGLRTRACRTRMGVCTALGEEWLERARDNGSTAHIFTSPLEWLRNQRKGAAIVDWRSVRHVLADVPALSFDDELLARRIDGALRQPVHMPQLFIREGASHAG